MMIRYWQPFREIESLRRQIDHAFDELTNSANDPQSAWTPAIELIDGGDNFLLRAQLPGMSGKDLDVQVTREAVAISGEYRSQQDQAQGYLHSEFRYGKFQRVIPLPVAIQNDQVQADFKDGILTLTLPKVTEARNRVVKINLGSSVDAASTPVLEAEGNTVN